MLSLDALLFLSFISNSIPDPKLTDGVALPLLKSKEMGSKLSKLISIDSIVMIFTQVLFLNHPHNI